MMATRSERGGKVVSLADQAKAMQSNIRVVQRGEWHETVPQAEAECKLCGGMGIVSKSVPVGHPDFGKVFPCPEQGCAAGQATKQRAWKSRLASAQIPTGYQDFTFESFEALAQDQVQGKMLAYAACRYFVSSPDCWVSVKACHEYLGVGWNAPDIEKNSLMLFGTVGTGKTGLAVAAANALMQQRQSVLYARARDVIAEVQKRYGQREDDKDISADEAQSMFREAPILIIDEFNMQNLKPDRLEIFESIMRHRASNKMPTIMTANVNQQEFLAMWGERTADVVFEMAHWIPVAGAKLRRTNGPLEAI